MAKQLIPGQGPQYVRKVLIRLAAIVEGPVHGLVPGGGTVGGVGDRAILATRADLPGALSMLRLRKASVQEESSPKREPSRRSSAGSISGPGSRRGSLIM